MTNQLRALLDELNMKPYRLADKVGITRDTAYRLTRGKEIPDVHLSTLRKIADAIGYRVEVSFTEKGE